MGSVTNPRRVADVMQRDIAGETFLVPVRGHLADLQRVFVLNDVGRWIWEHADGSRAEDDLVAEMVREFDVGEDRARDEVASFLLELDRAGLVEGRSTVHEDD